MKVAAQMRRGFAGASRPLSKVHPDEVGIVVLMTLTTFLLLTAYYLLKTVREPLILLQGGAEVKLYARAAQAVLMVGVVHVYGQLAQRVGRIRLLSFVFLFFLSAADAIARRQKAERVSVLLEVFARGDSAGADFTRRGAEARRGKSGDRTAYISARRLRFVATPVFISPESADITDTVPSRAASARSRPTSLLGPCSSAKPPVVRQCAALRSRASHLRHGSPPSGTAPACRRRDRP